MAPNLLADYLDFFDNVAFSDHPEWSNCYCIHFHWHEAMEAEFQAYSSTGKTDFTRVKASQLIQEGIIQGYLAYSDGKVVGWCNANDKKNYAALKYNVNAKLWTDDAGKKVKSVVCFLVAPDMRRNGIATKLLERVCADAGAEGYDFIEGYPPSGRCDMYAAHHGTVKLFEKFGFVKHAKHRRNCVMRKYLGSR